MNRAQQRDSELRRELGQRGPVDVESVPNTLGRNVASREVAERFGVPDDLMREGSERPGDDTDNGRETMDGRGARRNPARFASLPRHRSLLVGRRQTRRGKHASRTRWQSWRKLSAVLALLVALLALHHLTPSTHTQAQEMCDVLLCATLTVGVDPSDSAYRGFDHSEGMGSLSPRTFTHNGNTVTISILATYGDLGNRTLYLEYNGMFADQALTLEVGTSSLEITTPSAGDNYLEIDSSPFRWSSGNTLSVKLSSAEEVEDDATMSSISLQVEAFEEDRLVTLSPAFDPEVTAYTASVSRFWIGAFVTELTTTQSGSVATLILPDGSKDVGAISFVSDQQIDLGLNSTTTFFIMITAPDGVTTKTYSFAVTRGLIDTFEGQLTGLPASHDRSTAFSVTLEFDEDITSAASNVSNAIEVQGGTASNVAAVAGSDRKFTFTVTPGGGKRIGISVKATTRCNNSFAICTALNEGFRGLSRHWVSTEDDADAQDIWMTYSDGRIVDGSSALIENTSIVRLFTTVYPDVTRSWRKPGLRLHVVPYSIGATVSFSGGLHWDVIQRSDGGASARIGITYRHTVKVTVTSADSSNTRTYTYDIVPDSSNVCAQSYYSHLASLTVTGVGGSVASRGAQFKPSRKNYVLWMTPGTQSIDVSSTVVNSEGFLHTRQEQSRRLGVVTERGSRRLNQKVYVDWVTLTTTHRVDGYCTKSIYYVKAYTPATTEPAGLYASAASAFEQPGAELRFLVELRPAQASEVTVDYVTERAVVTPVPGATADEDYTPAQGRLTFAAGETKKWVVVPVLDDDIDEPRELLILRLHNARGAHIQHGRVVGTIFNSELTGTFKNLPQAHDGATAFRFQIEFNQDVTITPEGMRDDVLAISGGVVTAAEQVDGRADLWALTVQPSGADTVSMSIAAGRDCTELGAICASDERPLAVPLSAEVPGGAEPPDSAPEPIWTSTMTTSLVYQDYGFSGFADHRNGSLSSETFEADGVTYTVNLIEASGWLNVGFDRELPFAFRLEVDGAEFDSSDATHGSYSYADTYRWNDQDLYWDEGEQVELAIYRDDPSDDSEAATNQAASGVPTISGTAQVGQTLTADTSGIADDDGLTGVSYEYQWLRNDGAEDLEISGATSATYTLVDADQGQTIKVKVSFSDDAGNDEQLTSAATGTVAARPNRPATGTPSISGTAQVGQTLTADTSGIADADGLANASFSYQWIANNGTSDAEIRGATASTFFVLAEYEGQTIKLRVSFTDDAGHSESLTSAATDAVTLAAQAQQSNSAATGAPTISGTAQVGQTLSADTSGISDADGLTNSSYAYQWVRNNGTTDSDISGATSSTYTLVSADQDKYIKVKVTFTDDSDNDEQLTSAATGTVAARPNRAATGAPTINGTAQVGQTLSADTSGISDADGLTNSSYAYQWIRNNGTTDSDISGATSSTYTLIDADKDKTIRVKVSFTDDEGNNESRTSQPTGTVVLPPLTVRLEHPAASHDGSSVFTFEIRFSEEFKLSFRTLKFHAFDVTGGTILKSKRTEKGSNIRWRITVEPQSDGDVSIVLPATTDCTAQGAICTGDGWKLSNRLAFTVSGPS